MKTFVDQDTCIGCGLCAAECPDVYEMEGTLAKVIADPVPAESEQCARDMVDGCPVGAITVEE